jgi:hypothetical protein
MLTDLEKVPTKAAKSPTKLGPANPTTAVPEALRSQTAARGHNVFRPDIYRVSEGYIS